jgi:hypothetical protein
VLPQGERLKEIFLQDKAIIPDIGRRGWRPADISRSPEHHIVGLAEI